MTSACSWPSSRCERLLRTTRRQLPMRPRPQPRTSSHRTTSPSPGKAKVGRNSVRRGEIRWYTFALPDKRRPDLLLSRDAMLPSLNEVIVVPATRTIRGIDTEVVLTEDDGMPTACALNFDHVSLARKERIGATIARLDEDRWREIERALLVACGFAPNA